MRNNPPKFLKLIEQRRWQESAGEWLRLCLVCSAIAIVWCWSLGQVPLTPGEEQLADQAQQWLEQLDTIGVNPLESLRGLGQSPLTVALIALGQSLGGELGWSDRLPVAVFNLLSLPLLSGIARTLTGRRLGALLVVVVYGTALGVTYWARSATSNGLILPLTLIYLTSLLFCRRDLRGSLTLGLSLTALALTNFQTSVLLGVTGLIFLGWDTPRLLRTPVFWSGLALGLLPAIAWWGNDGWHHGGFESPFALGNDDKQIGWIWIVMSLPGLIFACTGFQQAKHAQHWSWARFLICQGGIYSLLVILAPWSSGPLVMPLFAPLALAAAISLTSADHPTRWEYPAWWGPVFLGGAGFTFLLLTGVYWQGAIASHLPGGQFWGLLWLALLAMTLMMTAILLDQHNAEFIAVLFWGLYVCLALTVYSPLWSTFLDWTNQWYDPPLVEVLTLSHHHFRA